MPCTKFFDYADSRIVYNHLRHTDLTISETPAQTHDVLEIIYLKSGELTYIIEGRSYRVKRNCLILTRPGNRHLIQFVHQDIYDRYDILFEESILSPGLFSQIPEELDVLNLESYRNVYDIFKKMDFYGKHFEGDTLQNLFSHLIEEIVCNIIIASKSSPENHFSNLCTANETVIRAVAYIEEHLSQFLTLDALCEELGITAGYLRYLFQRHLQISPKQYIITKRLVRAQRAIRSGARPTDVYFDCGFLDYSTFYRDYKNHFGYSPSEENEREIIREILS